MLIDNILNTGLCTEVTDFLKLSSENEYLICIKLT